MGSQRTSASSPPSPRWTQGTMATHGRHVCSPLTTEEVVDDRVCGTVGVHEPVGEGEAGVDGFPVAGLAEHPEHSSARKKNGEKQIRWARGRWRGPHRALIRRCPHCSLLSPWGTV